MTVTLTTTANVPTGVTVTVTVFEDTDQDGTAENQESKTISDGTNAYALPSLQGGAVTDYWISIDSDTSDPTVGEDLSVTLDIETPPFAPIGLETTTVEATSVDLSWTDESPNEDDFEVERAREYSDGFGPFETIAALAADSTTYSDTAVAPGTTYEYRVRATNQYGPSGYSNELEVTTTASGLPRTATRSRGWHVEVDHPDGSTLRPTVVGKPKRNPTVNGLPRVRVPVVKDEKWSGDAFERQPMRVWHDGEEQPIDELVAVEQQPGETVLVGLGGVELLERISESNRDFAEQKAHLAMEDVIGEETSYTANVDYPAASWRSVQQQSPDTATELQNLLASSPTADTPLVFADSSVSMAQTCFTTEAEDATLDTWNSGNTSGASGGRTVKAGDTGSLEFEFTPAYDVPAGKLDVSFRYCVADSEEHYGLTVTVDGQEVQTFAAGSLDEGWNWEHPTYSNAITADSTVTVGIESDGTSGTENLFIDLVAPNDNRHSYTFDNEVDGETLSGPELYPESVDLEFDDADPSDVLVGATATVEMDDVENGQALALSTDGGSTWQTESNAETITDSYLSDQGTVRLRVTLGRYGSESDTTPTAGDTSQELDSFALSTRLGEPPVLRYECLDGRIVDVLREIAEYGNFVFEFRREDGVDSVEVTQPGLREAEMEPDVVSYSHTKSHEQLVEKAVVFGASQSAPVESFEATLGSEYSLEEGPVVKASETVYDPNSGTEFERGTDYDVAYEAGTITPLSGGEMSGGTTYELSYRYKLSGQHALDGVSSPTERRFDFPSIPTEDGCTDAARSLVDKLSSPVTEAKLTIPKQPAGWNLVDSISVPVFPDDSALQIRGIEQTPDRVVVRLADRRSIREILSDIRDQVSSLSGQV